MNHLDVTDLEHLDPSLIAESVAFSGVGVANALRLLQALGATVHPYADNEPILRKGDHVDCYPVVLQGGVRAFLVQRGRERTVACMGKGESFAEAAASMPFCPVNVSASGPTLVLRIPAKALDTCPDASAITLKSNLTQKMVERIGTLAKNISVIGEPRLEDRILADLQARPHDSQGWVELPGTQRDWASFLRVDEKALSRKLREMREDGILKVEEGRVRVRD